MIVAFIYDYEQFIFIYSLFQTFY